MSGDFISRHLEVLKLYVSQEETFIPYSDELRRSDEADANEQRCRAH